MVESICNCRANWNDFSRSLANHECTSRLDGTTPLDPRSKQWNQSLLRCLASKVTGKVQSIRGNTIVAVGLPTPVGALCTIRRRQGQPLLAETIGFDGAHTLLAPLAVIDGVNHGDPVELSRTFRSVSVSSGLVGRVLDASGEVMDDLGPIPPGTRVACDAPR